MFPSVPVFPPHGQDITILYSVSGAQEIFMLGLLTILQRAWGVVGGEGEGLAGGWANWIITMEIFIQPFGT